MPVQVKTADGLIRFLPMPLPRHGAGPTIAQLIYLSGFFEAPVLCSGLGRCARCRVRFLPESASVPPATEADLSILGPEAAAEGWRLGCKHPAASGQALELPANIRVLSDCGKTASNFQSVPEGSENSGPAGPGPETAPDGRLAVDFGSTSLYAVVVRGAESVSLTPAVNPQMGAGSDIMSRLAWASSGEAERNRLQALSLAALRRMLEEAALSDAGANISEIVLAANPAMTYLLLGLDVSGLSSAPYRLDYRGGRHEELSVRTGPLPDITGCSSPGTPGNPWRTPSQSLPPVWVCPLISPFIGGDVSAGYAALALEPAAGTEYPFMLADLGTNGEFVLALDPERALAASLPLGPALEGMGMRCGAAVSAQNQESDLIITGFCLGPAGLSGFTAAQTEPCAPTGISATGYLSLLHNLRRIGLLDAGGHFLTPGERMKPQLTPLARKLLARIRISPQGEPGWFVNESLYVSAGDVEELLKVKAAFTLSFYALLQAASLSPADLKAVYLAGALGLHADIAALTGLGFLPEKLSNRIFPVGNTALSGAVLLSKKRELRQKLIEWTQKVRIIELTGREDFHRLFADSMTFN